MSKEPVSPHDGLFRSTFRQPTEAASLLRSILPAEIVGRIDWSTLILEPTSFVDKDLTWRHTDLLFSLRLDERPALIYTLVEHQSSSDPLMPLRIGGYVMRVLEHYCTQQPGTASTLPAVIPIVVSHCPHPWSAATELLPLFDLPQDLREELAPCLPNIRYLLDDLSAQTEDGLRARALSELATVTLLALRHARITKFFVDALARWADLLLRVPPDQLAPVLVYALTTGDDAFEDLQDVLQSRVGPEPGELIMSTAERLIQQGDRNGQIRTIQQQLLEKFTVLPGWAMERLAQADRTSLDHWSKRLLSAETVEAVFED